MIETSHIPDPDRFQHIGLIAKAPEKHISPTLKALVSYLERRGNRVSVDSNCTQILKNCGLGGVERMTLGNHCDLVIAIGGDGTMLSAAVETSTYDCPLLGINLGHLGFLADLPPDDLESSLDAIFDGEYCEEERFILHASLIRGDETTQLGVAINDIVIQKWNIARLINVETYIDGIYVNSQRSDGVIVSSPTGSTAYALSGGGPILHPELNALVLVPICPHTLSNRPIVVNADSIIELEVGTREIDQARLTCDGEIRAELEPGDRIRIKKHPKTIRLLHPANHDHYAILRAKLDWG